MDKLKMDDDVRALVLELKAMADKLRAKGLDDDDLQDLLLTKDEKGIVLYTDGRVSLLDYGKKVRFSPMERALYTLILKYVDGITGDDLWKYYDELVSIYGRMARFEDAVVVGDAIDTLLDDSRVTLYSNLSRIKKKITDAAGAAAARKYAILRGKDNAYRIAAPRDLISGSF